MTKQQNKLAAIKAIQAKQCKGAKKLVAGLTLQGVLQALQDGLGIRKKDWTRGRFAYLAADGQSILIGNLFNPCAETDSIMQNSLNLNEDLTAFEIVDENYILLAHLARKVGELNNLKDAGKIRAACRLLNVTVDTYGC